MPSLLFLIIIGCVVTLDFYVSPEGSGDVCDALSPCSVRTVRDMTLSPGDHVYLMDGIYTGYNSMLLIYDQYGTVENPIIFSALHDGAVLVNGTSEYIPILVSRSEHVIVEGMDACCSDTSVVGVSYCNHTTVRRVCAWDAHDGNTNIFGTHYGTHTTFEDTAGWGVCRKTYSSSQGGDYTTLRRAYGRWEGSTVVGPKMTFTSTYNNYHMLIENAIGTWSGERVPESFELLDYYGDPWPDPPHAGWYYDHSVSQPYAIFGIDRNDGDKCTNSTILGSIAYVSADNLLRFHPSRLFFQTKLSCVTFRDCVAYFDERISTGENDINTFGLYSYSHDRKLSARDLTSIGADGPYFNSVWNVSNSITAPSVADLVAQTGGDSIFVPVTSDNYENSMGANLCYRYENGVLTDTPLWPWPMNDRIVAASTLSGHTPIDVDAIIEGIFGEIPRRCRWDVNFLTAGGIAGVVVGSVVLAGILLSVIVLVCVLAMACPMRKKAVSSDVTKE